jgi:hypothetical protein
MNTSFRVSRLNLLLIVATALGVGTIWSFVIYYSTWKTQCNALLLQSEIDKHEVESQWKKKYESKCGAVASPRSETSRELTQLQTSLQRRNLAECVKKYGPGPYAVKFILALPDSLQIVIGVEIKSPDLMPHTTWTFLSLVENKFYTGTRIHLGVDHDEPILIGGDANDSSAWVKSALDKRHKEYGYDSAPFLFAESSKKASCDEHSFGLLNKGQDFVIHVEKNADDMSCIGKVVEGTQHLALLRTILKDQRVTIVEAKVVPPIKGWEGEL